jgi:hypothetical protein
MCEWAQGVLAIIEVEENVNIMRLMLAHYRAVFRDAQSHDFEAARWSSGVILTMLERGEVTWDNTLKMAEERRTALISPNVPANEQGKVIVRDTVVVIQMRILQ